jgi:hypothetical protein
MTQKPEASPEPISMVEPAETNLSKKAYESPVLVDWGSILELTGGPLSSFSDGDFSGSGGV